MTFWKKRRDSIPEFLRLQESQRLLADGKAGKDTLGEWNKFGTGDLVEIPNGEGLDHHSDA